MNVEVRTTTAAMRPLPLAAFVLGLFSAFGCDTREGVDAGPASDAGPEADAGRPSTDAEPPGDASGLDAGPSDAGPRELTVRCRGNDGPTVTVTRTGLDATSLLRLELSFEGGASGIALDEVVQRDAADVEVRSWDVSGIAGPPDFAGRVEAREGVPSPTVVFTAVAPSTSSEVEVCDGPWHARDGGRVDVRGRTAEGGAFEASCALGWDPASLGESLAFACARGVPGWLPQAFDAVSDVETPSDDVLLGTTAAAYGIGASAITDFVATEADVRVHAAEPFGFGDCPEPAPLWEVRGATHTLWRGSSSEEVWSGPLAPGALEAFHWFAVVDGDAPSDACVVPDVEAPPEDSCPTPSLQIVLRGTSSAGPWEWESDAFTCLLPPATK